MNYRYILSAGAVGLTLMLSVSVVGAEPDKRPMTLKQRNDKAIDGRIKAYMVSHRTRTRERIVYVDRAVPTPYPTYSYVTPTVVTPGLGLGIGTYTATNPAAVVYPGYADAGVPLQTGRSAAVLGAYCSTPVRTCLLSQASWVGADCSCDGPIRAYGSVSP